MDFIYYASVLALSLVLGFACGVFIMRRKLNAMYKRVESINRTIASLDAALAVMPKKPKRRD